MNYGRPRERSSSRKVTPPSPAYMDNSQFAAYLANLRDQRAKRPGGARPLPSEPSVSRAPEPNRASSGRPSLDAASFRSITTATHNRSQSDAPAPQGRPSISGSMSSRYSSTPASGRDYYPQQPTARPLGPSEIVPSATYIERGQRWMEKEEAFSLRQAMDAMDMNDHNKVSEAEEASLYNAALDEASELVWQHQNGIKPPEPGAPYRYTPHLRKNSYAHARTASVGRYGCDIVPSGLARDGNRSVSGSSSGSEPRVSLEAAGDSIDQPRSTSVNSSNSRPYGIQRGPSPSNTHGRRRSSMKRNISGEIQKPFSGDQIWEEPEHGASERVSDGPALQGVQPLALKTKNPLARVQFAPQLGAEAERGSSPTGPPSKALSRFEIHQNPPTQSRNPQYTTNELDLAQQLAHERPEESDTSGLEVRSEEIRQATSMRLKDRSEKLPTPSAVSDSPGRPIVSFDADWRAPEKAADAKSEASRRFESGGSSGQTEKVAVPAVPSITVTPEIQTPNGPQHSPRAPTIQISGIDKVEPPMITISGATPSVPMIVLPEDPLATNKPPVIIKANERCSSSTRPLPPQPQVRGAQRRRPKGHWSPAPTTSSRATASCHECGFPIEGRFVALRGSLERFHPQCFTCFTCGTGLEALEISPEPDHDRTARLDRIRRRAAGEGLEEIPGQTMAEDGDSRLRFYCHLDWHELFAPRCKHCKTPIIGEHIVALGAHWHYGHFFCAECGDPFEQGMTHIEKDGYAWCVKCQTKRTERRAPKCKNCRKAVIGQYIQALGGEWHDECFRCATCKGGFDDGQIFPMEERGDTVVLCTRCRAIELKM